MIEWRGLHSLDGRWMIDQRPQGGYNLWRDGRFLATAMSVKDAQRIAEDSLAL